MELSNCANDNTNFECSEIFNTNNLIVALKLLRYKAKLNWISYF